MSDRFTERMQNVVSIARGEALRFRHGEIGSEHLLLGVIEDDGQAAACLAGLKITGERLRDAIGGIPVRPRGDLMPVNIQFRQDAVAALDGAIQIAGAVGKTLAGPEHLLAALARNPDCGAMRAIRDLGVSVDEVRVAAFAAIGIPVEPAAGQAKGPVSIVVERSFITSATSPGVKIPVHGGAETPAGQAQDGLSERLVERIARLEAKVDEVLALLRDQRP